MALSRADLTAKLGRALLFIGNECAHWHIADFVQAAKSAKALGFDAIVPKRTDGVYRWYTNTAQLQSEQTAVEAEGIKYIPFGYLYGPAFGSSQIAQECALLAELQSVCHGVAVADMEREWNKQPTAAATFVAEMQKHPAGTLIVSTWADPVQQQWQDDIKTLEPIVSAWWPQQYDNWLAAQEHQFIDLGAVPVQPTIAIRNDVGPNDPLAIVKSALGAGCQSISVWEYQYALAAPDLTKSITAFIAQQQGDAMKVINLSDVATDFKDAPGNAWQCLVKDHEHIIGNAMLECYRRYGGDALCGRTYLGWPDSEEIAVPSIPGATVQRFQCGVLIYDPEHKYAPPPGAGPVYPIDLYTSDLGIDPRVPALQHQVAALQQQLTDSQKNSTASVQAVQQIKTIVAPL